MLFLTSISRNDGIEMRKSPGTKENQGFGRLVRRASARQSILKDPNNRNNFP